MRLIDELDVFIKNRTNCNNFDLQLQNTYPPELISISAYRVLKAVQNSEVRNYINYLLPKVIKNDFYSSFFLNAIAYELVELAKLYIKHGKLIEDKFQKLLHDILGDKINSQQYADIRMLTFNLSMKIDEFLRMPQKPRY